MCEAASVSLKEVKGFQVGPTQAELEVIFSTGLISLHVQVLQQHHNRGIDVLRVLQQPLTVEVVAVVGH